MVRVLDGHLRPVNNSTNRARIDMTYEWLASKLGLPEGTIITSIADETARNIISLYVNNNLPAEYDTPEGQECLTVPTEKLEEWEASSNSPLPDIASDPKNWNLLS